MDDEPHAFPQSTKEHSDAPKTAPPGRGRLTTMGIFQIILGGLSVLFILIVLIGAALSSLFSGITHHPAGSTVPSILSSLMVYVLAAIFFFVVGVGSLKARRWVRPIVLSVMWPSLIFGLAGFAVALFVLPGWFDILLSQAAPGMRIPAAVITLIQTVVFGTLLVIAVLIPAVHVLAYQSRRMKKSLEALDPKIRWTDRCPTSVLGMVITVVSVGILQLSMLSLGFTWMFGATIVGKAAYGVCLVEAVVALGVARLVYSMTPAGWWAGLGYMVFVCLKFAVSFLFADITDAYRSTEGFSEEQLEQLAEIFQQSSFAGITAAMWIAVAIITIGYMMTVRKHFRRT